MPAGYSGTPLVRKLGLEEGIRVCFVGAPSDYASLLGPLPDDVKLLSRPGRDMDFLHLFSTSRRDLERRLPALVQRLATAGRLWISWPKKAARVETDLSGDVVRAAGLATGLVDIKVCAVDEVWSGLLFVRRVKDR